MTWSSRHANSAGILTGIERSGARKASRNLVALIERKARWRPEVPVFKGHSGK
jgi:hypothetical protein